LGTFFRPNIDIDIDLREFGFLTFRHPGVRRRDGMMMMMMMMMVRMLTFRPFLSLPPSEKPIYIKILTPDHPPTAAHIII